MSTITASSSKREWVEYMRAKHGEDVLDMTKEEIIKRASELENRDYAPTQSPLQPRTAAAREIAAAKKVKIRITSTDDSEGQQPVFVGVNGVAFLIRRDEDVEVPVPVYEVLANARQTVFKQESDGTLTPREVPRYPFSLVA